jgi:Type II secretion system (T2SS), protein J
VIIRQIKSAYPYKARNRDDEEYPFFFGGAKWVTFVTATGLEGGGGLVRVSYQVADDPPRLVMTESAFFSRDQLGRDPVDKHGGRSAVLLENFRDLRFEYMLSDGIETEWRSDWSGLEEENLPAAVRILVDGIPGLEVDRWGQEIPIMSTLYGDSGGEIADDDEGDVGAAGEDADEPADKDDEPGEPAEDSE